MIQYVTYSEAPAETLVSSRTYTGFYSVTANDGTMAGTTSSSTSNGSVSNFSYWSSSKTGSGSGSDTNGYAYEGGSTTTGMYSYSDNYDGATEVMDGLLSYTYSSSANLFDESSPPNITSTTSTAWTLTSPLVLFWGYNVWPFSWSISYTYSTTPPDTATYTDRDGTFVETTTRKDYTSATTTTTFTWAYTSSTTSTTTHTTNSTTGGTQTTSRKTTSTVSREATTVVDYSTSEGTGVDWSEDGEHSFTYEDVIPFSASTTQKTLTKGYVTRTRQRSKAYVAVDVVKCQSDETGYSFTSDGFGRIVDVAATFDSATVTPYFYYSKVAREISAIDSSARVTITAPVRTQATSSQTVVPDDKITFAQAFYAHSLPEFTWEASFSPPANTTKAYGTTTTGASTTFTAKATSESYADQSSPAWAGGRGVIIAKKTGLTVEDTSSVSYSRLTLTAGFNNPPTSVSSTGTFASGGSTGVYNEGITTVDKILMFASNMEISIGAGAAGFHREEPAGTGRSMPMDMTTSVSPETIGAGISASPPATWIPAISSVFQKAYAVVSYPSSVTALSGATSITARFEGNSVFGTTASKDTSSGIVSGTVSARLSPMASIPKVTRWTMPYITNGIVPPNANSYALNAGVYRSCDGSSYGSRTTYSRATVLPVTNGFYIEAVGHVDARGVGWRYGNVKYIVERPSVTAPERI